MQDGHDRRVAGTAAKNNNDLCSDTTRCFPRSLREAFPQDDTTTALEQPGAPRRASLGRIAFACATLAALLLYALLR